MRRARRTTNRLVVCAAFTVLSVQVVTADGVVAWRYQLAGPYAAHRGAIAPDGTVYVQDVLGTVYAFSATGQLLWTYETGGLAEGPLAVGADRTIYAGGNPAGADVQIHAIHPDGSNRWTFSDPGVTQGIIAGPALGPDGNIYAVTDFGGLGVFSVSGADGQLRWSDLGDPQISERGQTGAEITFGARQPGGAVDAFCVAFDMVGQGTGTGKMFEYTLNGSRPWGVLMGGDGNVGQFQPAAGRAAGVGAVYVSSLISSQGYRLRAFSANNGSALWDYPSDAGPPTSTLTQPTIGPDGAIYIMRNLGQVHAVNPDGSNRWTHSTSYVFSDAIMVDPTNNVVVAGGRITYGQPGFVKGLDAANGQPLWTIDLPDEAGVHMIPFSRPWFTADGRRAYITTTLPGSTAGGFLYAIDLVSAVPGDVDGDGHVNLSDLALLLSSFGLCAGDAGFSAAADFDASGCVELADLAILLTNFGS
ncbi:MAG: PQQ-binding-like beta-propeller repeat protein [Planctomycetes bacterium]|nr:PQQ-binding-like beta-propeller repeat protein [Planctomycetota bacterium]